MFYLSIAAVAVILAIAYKNELKSFFGKLKPKKKDDSTFRPAVYDSKNNDSEDAYKGWAIFACILSFVAVGFLVCGIIVDYNRNQEDKHPLKEMVLTISDVDEGNNGCKYVKFSDGHTIKVDEDNETKWWLSKKGDKVRKLIYKNKEPEYTPEFDDNINKDSKK